MIDNLVAKEQGIKTITKNQQIFAINENIPNANPVKVQSVEELEDFRKTESSAQTSSNIARQNVYEIPQTPASNQKAQNSYVGLWPKQEDT